MPRASRDVRGARFGGDGAVAVLGDGGSGGGCDEGGGGGDVEGAAEVSAGAAGVDEGVAFGFGEREGGGGGAHGVDEAGEFGGMLGAAAEGTEERGEFDLGGLAGEDGLHERASLVAAEGCSLFHQALEVGLERHRKRVAGCVMAETASFGKRTDVSIFIRLGCRSFVASATLHAVWHKTTRAGHP